MSDIASFLRAHLADWRSGWSMGAFGAMAEFHQDAGDVAVIDEPADLARATRRGGVSIHRAMLLDLVPIAYETLSPKRHRWSQAVALCLPETAARRSQRSTLTELGPDDGAIRRIDRTGILFDMGLSLPQCDFCVRTSDPRLLAELRANLGRSLFDHGNTVMNAILKAHPHRVALTNIGRIEVYQKIGGPDTGGVSPPGPRTQMLPALLKSRRTHSANVLIPDGLLPLGCLLPGNPVMDAASRDRPFDRQLFDSFQRLLDLYGLPEIVAAKDAVLAALDAGTTPGRHPVAYGRFERSAMRLALRQQRVLAGLENDTVRLALLDRWADVLDPDMSAATEEDLAPVH